MVKLVVSIIKKHPEALDNIDFLKACMKAAVPELGDKTRCPNCEASMVEYIYHFDTWDAMLLLRMAQEVERRISKGMSFSEANKVRVPELDAGHVIRCRTTQASKLGLVTQLKSGSRRVAGTWVITKRGWEALSGKPVPAKVKVWRGRIEERYEETITISDALRRHENHVRETLKRGKEPRHDHTEEIREYDSKQWYEFSYHAGALL